MEGDTGALIGFVVLFTSFLFLYCFFLVSSVALSRSSISKVTELEAQGVLFAKKARQIIKHEDYYHLSCQLGQLIAASSFGWLFYAIVHRAAFERLLINHPGSQAFQNLNIGVLIGGVVAILILALLTFTLIQIAKAVVGVRPERILCYAAWPIIVIGKVLAPVAMPVRNLSDRLLGVLGLRRARERDLVRSAEDINVIVQRSNEAGEIDDEEREMIQGVFAFSDTLVQEVMTPRKDIVFVKIGQSLAQVVETFKVSRFSRLLVSGVDLDEVHGVVLVKDLLPFVGNSTEAFDLSTIMRPPYFCSATEKVDDLLDALRVNAVHLAVVRDEHGGVDGIVTLEDLVEEIVGDIVDEFDIGEEEKALRLPENGDLLVNGGMSVYDLNHDYQLNLPEGEYSTIAGYVFHALGRIPNKGETFTENGFTIKVEKVIKNRVKLVRISWLEKSPKKLKLVGSQVTSDSKKNESPSSSVESKEREKSA